MLMRGLGQSARQTLRDSVSKQGNIKTKELDFEAQDQVLQEAKRKGILRGIPGCNGIWGTDYSHSWDEQCTAHCHQLMTPHWCGRTLPAMPMFPPDVGWNTFSDGTQDVDLVLTGTNTGMVRKLILFQFYFIPFDCSKEKI